MLQRLQINNYALIEKLDIEFNEGFSVITGETGAGKSIILGALGILLGNRIDVSAVRHGASRCIVEAEFDIRDYHLESFFADNDLEYEEGNCIIRRELTSAGKSRAFVNDTPVNLSVLKSLNSYLIDIHSQHQNLLINNESFQIDVLDTIAGNKSLLFDYQDKYKRYLEANKSLQALRESIQRDKENHDMMDFQYSELDRAKLVSGEQEELEAESLVLDNAESIKGTFYDAEISLTDDDTGVIDTLNKVCHQMSNISRVYPKAADLYERLNTCSIELKDIANEAFDVVENISFDESRQMFVNSRLDTIYSLQKKYRKSSVDELILLRDSLKSSLDVMENSDELLQQKEKECSELASQTFHAASLLTTSRHKASSVVEQEMQNRLMLLGMPNIQFKVHITSGENEGGMSHLKLSGNDDVSFLFSANKNVPLQEISRIASGGEIARVMLTLKTILCQHKQLSTIIFDEIDTGVSGNIAEQMAIAMQQMTNNNVQVISITHLPQIAAKGNTHYRVYKIDNSDSTNTCIEQLDADSRVNEIAKMLSGSTISEAAINNAKELLKR